MREGRGRAGGERDRDHLARDRRAAERARGEGRRAAGRRNGAVGAGGHRRDGIAGGEARAGAVGDEEHAAVADRREVGEGGRGVDAGGERGRDRLARIGGADAVAEGRAVQRHLPHFADHRRAGEERGGGARRERSPRRAVRRRRCEGARERERRGARDDEARALGGGGEVRRAIHRRGERRRQIREALPGRHRDRVRRAVQRDPPQIARHRRTGERDERSACGDAGGDVAGRRNGQARRELARTQLGDDDAVALGSGGVVGEERVPLDCRCDRGGDLGQRIDRAAYRHAVFLAGDRDGPDLARDGGPAEGERIGAQVGVDRCTEAGRVRAADRDHRTGGRGGEAVDRAYCGCKIRG